MDLIIFFDGLLYNSTGAFLIALGITILIRHTGFPDLTVDGSFTIGAAVFAVVLRDQQNIAIASVLAACCGAIAGASTAALNQFLGMSKVVASVVSMTFFILIAPYVSGGASIGLLKLPPFLRSLNGIDQDLTNAIGIEGYQLHFITTAFGLFVGMTLLIASYRFFSSSFGSMLRYSANSNLPSLVAKKDRPRFNFVGLMAGNAVVALGGSVEAVRRGGYTSNMGIGTILMGLTIVILGEALMKTIKKRDYLSLPEQYLGLVVGVLVYSTLLQAVLSLGLSFIDLKLATTLLLIVLLGMAGRFFPNTKQLF